jgi:hypothetical protein
MSRISDRWLTATALAVLAPTLAGAQEDLTLPPRILDSPRPPQARLADPPAAATDSDEPEPDALQEIVVKGDENPWRLPDLGSEWRAREAERRPTGRINAEAFPLWDPEADRIERELLPLNSELRRVGFIQVFRIRFGRRR